MATITLTGNTNVSALTIANGDTIDLAGFALTLNVQPTATTISVVSPGTAGTVSFSGAWVIPTWSFTAGTVRMIETLPAGASIGTATGGTATNAQAVGTNSGSILSCVGGTGTNTFGCSLNGSGATIGTSRGGVGASGVNSNLGYIDVSTGSLTNAFHGCGGNSGTVGKAVGGSVANAFGVSESPGIVLRLTDATARAINVFRGNTVFVLGPEVLGTIASPITQIYSFGRMNDAATLPIGSTLFELSDVPGGFTGLRGR